QRGDERQGIADWQLVEIGQPEGAIPARFRRCSLTLPFGLRTSAFLRPSDFGLRTPPLTPVQQRLRLKATAAAIRARRIGPVTREQDAHMHLIGLRFEPAEVALDAIPGARPFVRVVLAVARLAFNDQVLPFLRQLVERHVSGYAKLPARAQQVVLALRAEPGLPGTDHALRQRSGAVGQRQVVINADDAAKAAARRAGADGVVEAEQRGCGFAV